MFVHQGASPVYPAGPYRNPVPRIRHVQTTLLDINWFDTWPNLKSILLASIMLLCSAAIIGLDIANLAIEGNKGNGTASLGLGPAKVGAGIWSGSISFLAGIFILIIVCVRNKRIAATFALIVVTMAFFFTIVLVGLTANSIQIDHYPIYEQNLDRIQYKLLIAILSLALFVITHCIIFFVLYIRVFFSSWTRRSTKY